MLKMREMGQVLEPVIYCYFPLLMLLINSKSNVRSCLHCFQKHQLNLVQLQIYQQNISNLILKVCSGYKYAFPMFLLPTNVSFTYVKLGVIPVYSDSNHVENSAQKVTTNVYIFDFAFIDSYCVIDQYLRVSSCLIFQHILFFYKNQ